MQVTTRFGRLRAAMLILRGHSVAYRINFLKDGGGEGGAPGKSAYWLECQWDGRPMALGDVWHGDPGQQDMS